MFPNILLTTERGVTAARMRFRRPAMWVARLALRAARPSVAHYAVLLLGSAHRLSRQLRSRRMAPLDEPPSLRPAVFPRARAAPISAHNGASSRDGRSR